MFCRTNKFKKFGVLIINLNYYTFHLYSFLNNKRILEILNDLSKFVTNNFSFFYNFNECKFTDNNNKICCIYNIKYLFRNSIN